MSAGDILVFWDELENTVKCELPITLPTSKVRVKRKGLEPVATRQVKLCKEDYIEWQISYGEAERLSEFGEILALAYRKGIIKKDDIDKVKEEFKNIKTFEELYKISREEGKEEYHKFKILYEKTPILRYEFDDGHYIDIVLRHKQRAVGYQAMVFMYIPIDKVEPKNLIGRRAYPKERIIWTPKREHILGLLKAFLIASRDHREDMLKIIDKIIQS